MIQLYTLLESQKLPCFSSFLQSLSIVETRFDSTRKLNKAISKHPPDILLAEFIYGFGNNYAGVNVSNLDVSLYTLQRHAPNARLVILADKPEIPHLPKLEALFEIHALLTPPVNQQKLQQALDDLND